MGPRVLLTVLIQAIGVYLFVTGITIVVSYVPYYFEDTVSSDWRIYWDWIVYPGVWLVLGVWLFFKGRVLARIVSTPAWFRCDACSYDLRGSSADRCPECGHPCRGPHTVTTKDDPSASDANQQEPDDQDT